MEYWKNKRVLVHSGRLLLTPLELTDAQDALEWVNNPEVVKNFQFFTGKATLEHEVRYIKKMQRSKTDLLLGLFLNGEELIGTCGLHEIDFKNDTARLGVIVGKKEHWNKGYAEEAIRAVLNWAFSVMNLHKVYLNVFVTNKKAFHLYSEVGFVKEGTPRGEYKIRGQYIDMLRMAVIKEEWKGEKNDGESSD